MTNKLRLFSYSLVGLCLMAVPAHSQKLSEHNVWNDEEVNQLTNIRYGALNPTRLSYNTKQTSGFTVLDYTLTRGKYHAIDKSGDQNDLNFFLGGLKHVGKFDLSGYLRYINTKADNKAWNSTLFLTEDNPFIFCDSVNSDMTTEAFQMEAAGSYAFAPRWKGAISIGLLTGSMSDQTDPRPKVNSSKFPVTAGAEWQMNNAISLGLAGNISLYRSNLSNTIINNLINYRYFLMKGMGDYYGFSSSGESGYPREYKGNSEKVALQLVYAPKDKTMSDFLEIAYRKGNENAEDGGSAYTFKGGDYSFSSISVTNRTMYKPSSNVMHNLILKAQMQNGEGKWYDQIKKTDTAHANRSYYEIEAKNTVYKSSCISADAEYRLDLLKDGDPDFYASGDLGLKQNTYKHFKQDPSDPLQKQQYAIAHFNLSVGKNWTFSKYHLLTSLYGGYYFSIGDKTFASGNIATSSQDITNAYVIPQFEYYSSKHINMGGMIDLNFPIQIRQNNLKLGIYAKVGSNIYSDNSEYSSLYKSKSLTTANFGVYLNF